MDRLTRLVLRARQNIGSRSERFSLGMVFPDRGLWVAQATVWTGKKGSGRDIVSKHDTEQEAVDALYAVYNEYPNNKEDVTIIIDDIDDGC